MEDNNRPLIRLIEEIIERGEIPPDKQMQVKQLALGAGQGKRDEMRALKDLAEKIDSDMSFPSSSQPPEIVC